MSGMPQSVLENTGKILWSNKQWIDLTQAFLCHINGMIILPNPRLPQPMWQHDSAIMKNFQGLHLPKNKAIQVNSVQMFLRVFFSPKSPITPDVNSSLKCITRPPTTPQSSINHQINPCYNGCTNHCQENGMEAMGWNYHMAIHHM